MRVILFAALLCAGAAFAFGQATALKESATILDLRNHPGSPRDHAWYDISLRVGNTIYTILYTQPAGAYGIEFSVGDELLVSIGTKTITYNDTPTTCREVPIVSRQSLGLVEPSSK